MSVQDIGIYSEKLQRKRKADEARKEVNRAAAERARERKRQERRRDYTGHVHGYQVTKAHIDKAFVAAALAALPEDTRTVTQTLCGDPLPGRSALDRRGTEKFGELAFRTLDPSRKQTD